MSIKDKLLKYCELKGISKTEFCKKTGVVNGFFNKGEGVGSLNLEAILGNFQDLSADWLLRGEGEMLRKTDPEDTAADNPLHIDIEAVKLLIAEKDRTIANLQEQLDKKDQQIDRLIQALSTPH
ncbi:MAG: hypothetical protein J6S82_05690 [Bacteroidales bacterium]|nr:hypothetical protein [Bacteroidales bacterium]